jgi:nucleoside-diphosphate-sugar epimerase
LVSEVVIPDVSTAGAFDEVLKNVVGVIHVASPIPSPVSSLSFQEVWIFRLFTQDSKLPPSEFIQIAVEGTTGILNSALKHPSIKRIIITSSIVAIIGHQALSYGEENTIYTSSSRLDPLPQPPFEDVPSAYRGAKALALEATDKFLMEKKPHFTIVNLMPGYVFGRHEFATSAADLLATSNVIPLSIVLGKQLPGARPGTICHIDDVARIHVEALDEEKVKGNRDFVIDSRKEGEKVNFDDAKGVVERCFGKEVEQGVLKLGGGIGSVGLRINGEETRSVFGELKGYEESVREVVEQFVELKKREV